LTANHVACPLHWDATIALKVFCVPLERENVAEGLEKQSSGQVTWPKRWLLLMATSIDMETLAQATASRQTLAFGIITSLTQRSRSKLSASRRLH